MAAPEELLLGLARAVRAAGVPVTADREMAFVEAASIVGLDDRAATRVAGEATLCASPEDLRRFGIVFDTWFAGGWTDEQRVPTRTQQRVASDLLSGGSDGEGDEQEATVVPLVASDVEVLRHRDVAGLSPVERAHLAQLFSSLRRPAPCRRSPRRAASRRGTVDGRRTLRSQLRRLGEPGHLEWHRRERRPRRVVLLLDVSGSMRDYAESHLRMAHHWVHGGGRVEVFTMGTRLTHVTRALHRRDADLALGAAGETVPDWSGGTRLGESLKAFSDRWGQRGMARGAVVVIVSDGWERSGVDLLGAQVRRLGALAHRVVWVNPHAGKGGYEPVQAGVRAVLPHCDHFIAGHSLQTFDDLAEVVQHA